MGHQRSSEVIRGSSSATRLMRIRSASERFVTSSPLEHHKRKEPDETKRASHEWQSVIMNGNQ